MKPGTQADIVREFGCSRTAISKLVKAKDYRIIYTPGKKINIEATVKALKDSGFGKRSKKQVKKTVPATTKEAPETETEEEETDFSKPLTLGAKRNIIEKHKAFHQSEKERINNDRALEKLIDVDDVSEHSFNLWRQVRDHMQSQKDRIAIKLQGVESIHEVEQILNDDSHQCLAAIIENYQELDEEALKKKLFLRLKPQT